MKVVEVVGGGGGGGGLKEGLKGLDMLNSEAQHASFPDYIYCRKKEGRDKIKIAKNK